MTFPPQRKGPSGPRNDLDGSIAAATFLAENNPQGADIPVDLAWYDPVVAASMVPQLTVQGSDMTSSPSGGVIVQVPMIVLVRATLSYLLASSSATAPNAFVVDLAIALDAADPSAQQIAGRGVRYHQNEEIGGEVAPVGDEVVAVWQGSVSAGQRISARVRGDQGSVPNPGINPLNYTLQVVQLALT